MCSILGIIGGSYLKKDSKKQKQITNAILAQKPQEVTDVKEIPPAEEIVKKREPVMTTPTTPVSTTGTGINTTPRIGLNL